MHSILLLVFFLASIYSSKRKLDHMLWHAINNPLVIALFSYLPIRIMLEIDGKSGFELHLIVIYQ